MNTYGKSDNKGALSQSLLTKRTKTSKQNSLVESNLSNKKNENGDKPVHRINLKSYSEDLSIATRMQIENLHSFDYQKYNCQLNRQFDTKKPKSQHEHTTLRSNRKKFHTNVNVKKWIYDDCRYKVTHPNINNKMFMKFRRVVRKVMIIINCTKNMDLLSTENSKMAQIGYSETRFKESRFQASRFLITDNNCMIRQWDLLNFQFFQITLYAIANSIRFSEISIYQDQFFIIDACYGMNILVNFFRMKKEHNDRFKIDGDRFRDNAWKYFKTWFFMDLLTMIDFGFSLHNYTSQLKVIRYHNIPFWTSSIAELLVKIILFIFRGLCEFTVSKIVHLQTEVLLYFDVFITTLTLLALVAGYQFYPEDYQPDTLIDTFNGYIDGLFFVTLTLTTLGYEASLYEVEEIHKVLFAIQLILQGISTYGLIFSSICNAINGFQGTRTKKIEVEKEEVEQWLVKFEKGSNQKNEFCLIDQDEQLEKSAVTQNDFFDMSSEFLLWRTRWDFKSSFDNHFSEQLVTTKFHEQIDKFVFKNVKPDFTFFFKILKEETSNRIISQLTSYIYYYQDLILEADYLCPGLFFILNGSVTVRHSKNIIMPQLEYGPGSIIGEKIFQDGQESFNDHNVKVASDKLEVLFISKNSILEILKNDKEGIALLARYAASRQLYNKLVETQLIKEALAIVKTTSSQLVKLESAYADMTLIKSVFVEQDLLEMTGYLIGSKKLAKIKSMRKLKSLMKSEISQIQKKLDFYQKLLSDDFDIDNIEESINTYTLDKDNQFWNYILDYYGKLNMVFTHNDYEFFYDQTLELKKKISEKLNTICYPNMTYFNENDENIFKSKNLDNEFSNFNIGDRYTTNPSIFNKAIEAHYNMSLAPIIEESNNSVKINDSSRYLIPIMQEKKIIGDDASQEDNYQIEAHRDKMCYIDIDYDSNTIIADEGIDIQFNNQKKEKPNKPFPYSEKKTNQDSGKDTEENININTPNMSENKNTCGLYNLMLERRSLPKDEEEPDMLLNKRLRFEPEYTFINNYNYRRNKYDLENETKHELEQNLTKNFENLKSKFDEEIQADIQPSYRDLQPSDINTSKMIVEQPLQTEPSNPNDYLVENNLDRVNFDDQAIFLSHAIQKNQDNCHHEKDQCHDNYHYHMHNEEKIKDGFENYSFDEHNEDESVYSEEYPYENKKPILFRVHDKKNYMSYSVDKSRSQSGEIMNRGLGGGKKTEGKANFSLSIIHNSIFPCLQPIVEDKKKYEGERKNSTDFRRMISTFDDGGCDSIDKKSKKEKKGFSRGQKSKMMTRNPEGDKGQKSKKKLHDRNKNDIQHKSGFAEESQDDVFDFNENKDDGFHSSNRPSARQNNIAIKGVFEDIYKRDDQLSPAKTEIKDNDNIKRPERPSRQNGLFDEFMNIRIKDIDESQLKEMLHNSAKLERIIPNIHVIFYYIKKQGKANRIVQKIRQMKRRIMDEQFDQEESINNNILVKK